jgi:ubiquitin-conjugating enzyme E2 S
VKLTLPKDFPQSPPKAFFITKIFHPNVASNGEICVNTLKKDWKPDLGIKHILLTIKCLLIVPNPGELADDQNMDAQCNYNIRCFILESALNEEAGKMLLEHYDDYSQRAKLMTEIHARPSTTSKSCDADAEEDGCSSSKKLASDKKIQDKKKEKFLKEKKRILKRL